MSRSVTMPATSPTWSMTMTLPTLRSAMSRATALTVVVGVQVTAGVCMSSLTLIGTSCLEQGHWTELCSNRDRAEGPR